MREEKRTSRHSQGNDPDRLLQRKYLPPVLLGLAIGGVVHVVYYFIS